MDEKEERTCSKCSKVTVMVPLEIIDFICPDCQQLINIELDARLRNRRTRND